MGIFNDISAKAVATEPRVWISRFVIFESIAVSPPKAIRDVSLDRGLNIIWAREDEGESPERGIYGHSAGKTTFCRLLRYLLGEASFGNQRTMRLIRQKFPEGYVAAEIHIAGAKWAVRRPIGKGQKSYIRKDSTIEQLLTEKATSVTQAEYTEALGFEGLVKGLPATTIIRSKEEIQWGHILSWCSRDQETRYQNLYEWRSPRSDSNSPKLSPKADPLFVMRSVLGLFVQEELVLQDRLTGLGIRCEQLKTAIEEKRHEPQYWITFYTEKLRRNLERLIPSEGDLSTRRFRDPPNTLPGLGGRALEYMAKSKTAQLEADENQLKSEAFSIQQQINICGVEVRKCTNKMSFLSASIERDKIGIAGIDAQKSKQQRDLEIQAIIASLPQNQECEYGHVAFEKCEYIRQRFDSIPIADGYDTEEAIQERADRSKRIESTENEQQTITKRLNDLQKQLKRLQELHDNLLGDARLYRSEATELDTIVSELDRWIDCEDNPDKNSELAVLQDELNQCKIVQEQLKAAISDKLKQHTANVRLLGEVFSVIVRRVLRNDRYEGKVGIESEADLYFQIADGPAMSGEAIETLSVLLADITSMIYGIISGRCHHPRFLLHDSPHEADLARSIYRSFIQMIANFQAEFDTPELLPFQYILTTTSAPPEILQNSTYVKLELSAPDNLLLHDDIRVEHTEAQALIKSLFPNSQ